MTVTGATKQTFVNQYEASGGRWWREGHVTQSMPYKLTSANHWWKYQREPVVAPSPNCHNHRALQAAKHFRHPHNFSLVTGASGKISRHSGKYPGDCPFTKMPCVHALLATHKAIQLKIALGHIICSQYVKVVPVYHGMLVTVSLRCPGCGTPPPYPRYTLH